MTTATLAAGTKVTLADTMTRNEILGLYTIYGSASLHTIKMENGTIFRFEGKGHKDNDGREWFWGRGQAQGFILRRTEDGDEATYEAQRIARQEAAKALNDRKRAEREAREAEWKRISNEWKAKNADAWTSRQEVPTALGTLVIVNVINKWDEQEVWAVTFEHVDDINWDTRETKKIWRASVSKMSKNSGLGGSSTTGKGESHEEAFWKLFD